MTCNQRHLPQPAQAIANRDEKGISEFEADYFLSSKLSEFNLCEGSSPTLTPKNSMEASTFSTTFQGVITRIKHHYQVTRISTKPGMYHE